MSQPKKQLENNEVKVKYSVDVTSKEAAKKLESENFKNSIEKELDSIAKKSKNSNNI
ncbi:hypothetical protein Sbal223_4531 (plasmid) [Shewanella baltica OS223]|uniref:hypothetical protein n=1 Tax=Shewanella baltica TaxID=62322 RepID=UPI0001883FC9|nr:hypothetical protein [Shewanella baltica]ACK48985.1 hypothetical protein Sbal223_4531 [Shewanella baltica OS223]ADT95530.1 heavy metal translocating P-type ATPase [Shewanella baltica OS678]